MIDYSRIPKLTMESLEAWVKDGRPVGSFLQAVLTNNLMEAVNRADDANLFTLGDIVGWLINEAPGDCWGSSAVVAHWANRHRARVEKRPLEVV